MLRALEQNYKSFKYFSYWVRNFSVAANNFEEAQRKFKASIYSEEPYEPEVLKLYGLYQQAYEGDITENEPPKKDVLGHKKYLAWKECKALSKEDAKQQYVDLVNTLMEDEKFKKYMLEPTEDCADYDDSAWKNSIPPATNPTVHHDQPPK